MAEHAHNKRKHGEEQSGLLGKRNKTLAPVGGTTSAREKVFAIPELANENFLMV